MEQSRLNPSEIEKFVRKKINHSYNKEVFDIELNNEIDNNLVKMEKSIIK